jgi:hypothetical protein
MPPLGLSRVGCPSGSLLLCLLPQLPVEVIAVLPLKPAENALVPPAFTAETTGNTFFLNITFTTHADAEANCVANGGHLAQYASYDEHKEVEQVRST